VTRHGRWWLLLLPVTALALGACAESQATGDAVVEMLDNSFGPAEVHVPVGGTVTFVGAGRNPHNAVASDGSWSTEDSFGSLNQLDGDAAAVTFDQPGQYEFFCTFHGTAYGSGMAGKVIVGDPDASAAAQGAAHSQAPAGWSGETRNVPDEYPTIQAAVDAAEPGDLILIAPGVYREGVEVGTPGLVIRGTDRNEVVIDADGHENAIDVFADGVAVENLTVRNADLNGIYWSRVVGYRASYVTAIDNGDYGIYAFDASEGLFEHSYASGSPDSGFYVGQCNPCRAMIRDVISEWNGLGYSGTNSSGDIYIVESVFRFNGAGIVPNTLDSELLPPSQEVVIAGNLVHDNDNLEAPMKAWEWAGFGNGIVLAGSNGSQVIRNRVVNHQGNGIIVTPILDKNFWTSSDNRVEGNLVEGSGRADLAMAGPAGDGNCFSDNQAATSLPPGLQLVHGCTGLRLPVKYELAALMELAGRFADTNLGRAPDNPVGSAPTPGLQEPMPDIEFAAVHPAVSVFTGAVVDLAAVSVPPMPAGLVADQAPVVTVFGMVLGSATSTFFEVFGYFLPVALYAAWLAIALIDLAQSGRSGWRVVGWLAVILLVPLLGPIIYFVFGRSKLPAWLRWGVVVGGLLAYAVVLGLGALAGGLV
jgi:plastocyanin